MSRQHLLSSDACEASCSAHDELAGVPHEQLPTNVLAALRRMRDRRREGMTLIEIMIVVVIMALVATGVGVAVLPALDKAKKRQAETAVATVRGAVEMYRSTNNSDNCPTMAQLLEDKTINKNTATTDPWSHEFQIECDGTEINVRSAGPDGQFETDDDIPKKN